MNFSWCITDWISEAHRNLAKWGFGGTTPYIRCCFHLLSQIVGIGSGCPLVSYVIPVLSESFDFSLFHG